MGVTSYNSRNSKRLFINHPFRYGMNHTSLMGNEGAVKSLINYDIANSGNDVFPRPSFVNTLLHGYDFGSVVLPEATIMLEPNNGKKQLIAFDSWVSKEDFLNDTIQPLDHELYNFGIRAHSLTGNVSHQNLQSDIISIQPAVSVSVLDYNIISVNGTSRVLYGVELEKNTTETRNRVQELLENIINNFNYVWLYKEPMSLNGEYYLFAGDNVNEKYLVNALLQITGNINEVESKTVFRDDIADAFREVYLELLSETHTPYTSWKSGVETDYDESIVVSNKDLSPEEYDHFSDDYPTDYVIRLVNVILQKTYWKNSVNYSIQDILDMFPKSKFNTVFVSGGDYFKTEVETLQEIDTEIYDTLGFEENELQKTDLFQVNNSGCYIQILRNIEEKEDFNQTIRTSWYPHVNMSWKNRVGFIGRVIQDGAIKYKGLIQIQWVEGESLKIIITKPRKVDPLTWNTEDVYSLSVNALDKEPYIFNDEIFTQEAGYFSQPIITTSLIYSGNPEIEGSKLLKSFDKKTECYIKPWLIIPDINVENFKKIEIRFKLDPKMEDDEGWFDLVLPVDPDDPQDEENIIYNLDRSLYYKANAIDDWNNNNPIKDFSKVSGETVEVEMRTVYSDTTTVDSFTGSLVANVDYTGVGYEDILIKRYSVSDNNIGQIVPDNVYNDLVAKAGDLGVALNQVFYTNNNNVEVTDPTIIFYENGIPHSLTINETQEDSTIIISGCRLVYMGNQYVDLGAVYGPSAESYNGNYNCFEIFRDTREGDDNLYETIAQNRYNELYSQDPSIVKTVTDSANIVEEGDLAGLFVKYDRSAIGYKDLYYLLFSVTTYDFVENTFVKGDDVSVDYTIITKLTSSGNITYEIKNTDTGTSDTGTCAVDSDKKFIIDFENLSFELIIVDDLSLNTSVQHTATVNFFSETYYAYSSTQLLVMSGKKSIDSNEILTEHNIYNATDMVLYDKYIILYGEGIGNNSLQFLEYDDESYASFPYGQISFDTPITHIHKHRNTLYVFCEDGVWILHNGLTYEDMEKVFAYSGVKLSKADKSTVISLGNNVYFMHNNKGYMLRTNNNVEDQTDVYTVVITDPISEILENPKEYIRSRTQKGYGLIVNTNTNVFVSFNVYSDNNEIYLYATYELEESGQTFLTTYIYDNDKGRWRMYDSLAAAYPIHFFSSNNMKGFDMLCSNSFYGGIITNATYLYDSSIEVVNENKYADILAVVNRDGYWVLAGTVDEIANTITPIACEIDSGSLDIESMHKKIVREFKVNVTNIEGETINFKFFPYMDGVVINDDAYVEAIINSDGDLESSINVNIEQEIIEPETYHFLVIGTEELEGYTIPESMFTTTSRVILVNKTNMIGRLPGFSLVIPTSSFYRISHYGMVYRQRMAR